jgi:hypothetical protein
MINNTQYNYTQNYKTQCNNQNVTLCIKVRKSSVLQLVTSYRNLQSECHNLDHYTEFLYAECRYAECRYAECRYAECRYAECCFAECRGAVPLW